MTSMLLSLGLLITSTSLSERTGTESARSGVVWPVCRPPPPPPRAAGSGSGVTTVGGRRDGAG